MPALRWATLAVALACRREPPPPVDRCAPFVKQMDDQIARGGRCEVDADCAYFPQRASETAGVTDKASALELERLARLYTTAQCAPPLSTSPLTRRQKTVKITCEQKHCMGSTFF